MRNSFIRIKIQELGRIVTGHTPPKKIKEYYGSEHVWLKPTDMTVGSRYVYQTEECYSQKAYEKYKKSLLPPLSTCVVTIGTIGEKICLTREKCFTNQSVNAVIPDQKLYDPMFVFYLLKHNLYLVASRNPGTASGRDHVSKSNFSSIEIELPKDIETQIKIGNILARYDDLIENNTRRIKLLESMAKLIYDEWFVKFKFPGHETVKLVDSGTDFGEIPEGWLVKKISDVATITKGLSYKSENLVEDGKIAFITLKCIARGGGFRYDGLKRFEGEFKEKHTVVEGDIVMAVTDMTQNREIVARAARVPRLKETTRIISMDLVKVTPTEHIDKSWLYGLLNYSDFGIKMKEFANGVNVLHLKSEPIEEYEFILPPEKIRNDFSKIVSKIYYQIDNLELKNLNLAFTRDHLLPKLISGELDVSELDIKISEVEA